MASDLVKCCSNLCETRGRNDQVNRGRRGSAGVVGGAAAFGTLGRAVRSVLRPASPRMHYLRGSLIKRGDTAGGGCSSEGIWLPRRAWSVTIPSKTALDVPFEHQGPFLNVTGRELARRRRSTQPPAVAHERTPPILRGQAPCLISFGVELEVGDAGHRAEDRARCGGMRPAGGAAS